MKHSRRRALLLASLLPLGVACGSAHEGLPDVERTGQAKQAVITHYVTVNPDGTFSPDYLTIESGDTVVWQLHDNSDSIIPIDWAAPAPPPNCQYSGRQSYDPADPNNFVGPMPDAPSGVFVIGPPNAGDAYATYPSDGIASACPAGSIHAGHRNGMDLCKGAGVDFTVMPSTWQSNQIAGVFIRLYWKDVHISPVQFDFERLDDQIDQAIANGKLYSLVVKAGEYGTPDWIFDHGVTKLHLRDGSSHLEPDECGRWMHLGSPTEEAYQTHYLNMLSAVAAHIKERADRYRALAYIKPSGANLGSPENRLPKACKPTECGVCNPARWAAAGYTPSGLLAFYQAQFATLATEFPTKAMSYALIQAGFPLVNDDGDYVKEDGASSGGPLPSGTAQTARILELGRTMMGPGGFSNRFVPTHNGLGEILPPFAACTTYGMHPVEQHPLDWYTHGNNCPNKWVLYEGTWDQVTGFQTNNTKQVKNTALLDQTFQNMWENSDGVFLEIYERLLWEAGSDVLDPDAIEPRSIAQWDARLDSRQPKPMTHKHTFTYTGGGGLQHVWYVHGQKCRASGTAATPAVINIIEP